MSENKENALHISAEVMDELRKARAEMTQSFNDHTAGKNPLSAEQSLALRSHIAILTEFIEPGVKEMWPGYSTEEQEYLRSQSNRRLSDANSLAIAVLGPLAAPAIAADNLGAPPEIVSNFIELGFNMSAAAGLNKVGLRNLHDGVLEPVFHPRMKVRITDTLPTNRAASNDGFFNARPVTDIKDFVSPRATAQKHIRSALDLRENSQPIRDWMKQGDLAKLYPIIEKLGGNNALLSANGKINAEHGVTIPDLINSYRQSSDGPKMVIKDAQRFVVRMMEDIASNGELDPVKLQTVIAQMQAGEYLGAHEFAAVYYVRQLAHTKFVESKVHDFLAIAKIVKIEGQNLTDGIAYVRERAEAESPYGRLSEAQDRPPPASPEPGQER